MMDSQKSFNNQLNRKKKKNTERRGKVIMIYFSEMDTQHHHSLFLNFSATSIFKGQPRFVLKRGLLLHHGDRQH